MAFDRILAGKVDDIGDLQIRFTIARELKVDPNSATVHMTRGDARDSASDIGRVIAIV